MERGNAQTYLATNEDALGGTNLELKVRVRGLPAVRERLRAMQAELQGSERQEDRYFPVPAGRLKLRVSSRDGAHLVAYVRPEDGDYRTSCFQRLPAADPEALAATLSKILGEGPRVVKTREVWWWRDVRVHLDDVEERGEFVELEARIDRIGDPGEAASRLDELCRGLMLPMSDVLRVSYGEMG